MSSEPPEEPHLRSEFSVLSPASPKPIHFPAPTNIPVLEMQTDVGFNQTDKHMSDPAMRNTEVRPDYWRDPIEQQQQEGQVQQQQPTAASETMDHASPYSTGGENDTTVMDMDEQQQGDVEVAPTSNKTYSTDTTPTNAAAAPEPEPVPISTSTSPNVAEIDAQATQQHTQTTEPSSDPSVPTAEATYVAPTLEDTSDQAQMANAATQSFNGGTVDVQALLDTLQTAPGATSASSNATNTAPQAEGLTVATTLSPSLNQSPPPSSAAIQQQQIAPGSASSPLSASALGAPPSGVGLPPRPPPQEQPLIHPNYVHSQHIRDYHPHAAHPAFQPQHVRSASGSSGNVADPSSKSYVPPVHSPTSGGQGGVQQQQFSLYPASAVTGENGQQQALSPAMAGPSPGIQQAQQHQQYLPSASGFATSPADAQQQQHTYAAQQFYQSMSGTPMESRRESVLREGQVPRPEDRPWDADTQRKYDRFIEEERKYVSEGRWEQFPQGSRLFVGNLSSEKVTKRDIFHVFHLYGDLAQISIKQAYGFVQFLRTEDCMRALDAEQGTLIRDKRIHLEVSKPQKNRPQNNQNTQRRSRSPPANTRGRPGANVDRYVSGSRPDNNRNGYRPAGYRSPSPARGYRDRYDDRYRARSRTPPAYGRSGGGRYRSPSPRRVVPPEDDLPLPRRDPRDVPDVQILVLDSLERDFISWVEQAFASRSVRVDVLLLSPRLSEQAVVRRQIMEGVVAVVKLTRNNQNTGKIGLQIFDRRAGVGNVKFEEYDGLEPKIAVELVLRAKGSYAAVPPQPQVQQGYGGYGGHQQYSNAPAPPTPQQQQYGGAPYGGTYGQPPQAVGGYPPGYAQQPTPSAAVPAGVPPHLQSIITNLDPNNLQNLLSAMNTPQVAAAASANSVYAAGTPASAVQALQNNPQLVGYLQQQQQQGAPPGGVNMQDILARLGSYQR
ncbi:nuclear polyadenylated RNA-binding protein 3 [Vermiconidia calcicola]|uniref:Nuclear polyadenylated RNA-binding protein 3 n=1 Tax=Vermiconidia calcicola TaxID=1690605 RepID=A0ACC3N1N9_9PEZI|nr:nuclear polyadenylated RNA-binding protein 3 [Vermiconidia calcicola]